MFGEFGPKLPSIIDGFAPIARGSIISALPYNLLLQGTQVYQWLNNQYCLSLTPNLSPATTISGSISSIANLPTLTVPTGTTAAGYGVNTALTLAGSGTITNCAGMFVGAGSLSGPTVTNSYGIYATNPGFGTNKAALYADNGAIGYTGIAPPSSGLIVSGNVGIGTNAPQSGCALTVQGGNPTVLCLNTNNITDQPEISIKFAGAEKWELGAHNSSSSYQFFLWDAVGGQDCIRINSNSGGIFLNPSTSAGVGIGNSSASYTLDVSGSIRSTSSFYLTTAASPAYFIYNGSTVQTMFGLATASGAYSPNANVNDAVIQTKGGAFRVETNSGSAGTSALTVLGANGNVGIGNASPSYKLDVNSDMHVNGTYVGRSGSANSAWAFNSVNAVSYHSIICGHDNNTSNAFEIGFNYIGGGSSSNYLGLGFYANGNILNVLAAGTVGIGTSSPTTNYNFDVRGNAIVGTTGNSQYFSIKSTAAQTKIYSHSDGVTYFQTQGNIFFIPNGIDTTNTPAVFANTSNQVGINTSSPNSSALLTLSSTSLGLLPPVMTTSQKAAISSPADGLVVYDSTQKALNVYRSDIPTWAAPGYYLIGSSTLGSAAASFTFSSIPATFNHLKLIIQGRCSDTSGNVSSVLMRFNNDSGGNYARQFLRGATNTGVGTGFSAGQTSTFIADFLNNTSSNPATWCSSAVVDIVAYAQNTFYKTAYSCTLTLCSLSGNLNFTQQWTTEWGNTSTINQIYIFDGNGGNFNTGTSVFLYGMI